jgi:hypothetical protein
MAQPIFPKNGECPVAHPEAQLTPDTHIIEKCFIAYERALAKTSNLKLPFVSIHNNYFLLSSC